VGIAAGHVATILGNDQVATACVEDHLEVLLRSAKRNGAPIGSLVDDFHQVMSLVDLLAFLARLLTSEEQVLMVHAHSVALYISTSPMLGAVERCSTLLTEPLRMTQHACVGELR